MALMAAVVPLEHWLIFYSSTFWYSTHACQNHQVVKTWMRNECNEPETSWYLGIFFVIRKKERQEKLDLSKRQVGFFYTILSANEKLKDRYILFLLNFNRNILTIFCSSITVDKFILFLDMRMTFLEYSRRRHDSLLMNNISQQHFESTA